MTESGPSALDNLLGTWLDYQKVKASVDLESRRTDSNIPDRVDIATVGVPARSAITWQQIAIAAAGLVGLTVIYRLVK